MLQTRILKSARFESRPLYRLSLLRSPCFSSVLLGKMPGFYLDKATVDSFQIPSSVTNHAATWSSY
jgi:hypothetical protein